MSAPRPLRAASPLLGERAVGPVASAPPATAGGTALGAPPATIEPAAFQALVRLAREQAGLCLDEGKHDFLVARLADRVARRGLSDYGAYAELLQRTGGDEGAEERRRFAEALTTHTTSFFRERSQYDWLAATGLPGLLATGAGRERDLTIWSAACSSGQELWSALMVACAVEGLRVQGLGTDISRPVLRRCARALYDAREIEGIPLPMRRRHLLCAADGRDLYRIAPALRQRASWAWTNLTGDVLPDIRADIVLLRNVLIYFDAPTRRRVIDAVVGRLRPGGCLLVGHAEAVREAEAHGLQALQPCIYRKRL